MSDTCQKCNGTGVQPNGWTLSDARANPSAYNDHRFKAQYGDAHGMVALSGVVSPLQFLDDGRERCVECHGTGVSKEATARKVQDDHSKRIEYFQNLIGGTEPIKLPEGQMFITICAYFNDSDSMSDYYAPHRTLSETYVIGVKKKGPRTEKGARSFVDNIPELQKLEWTWHKQDYSGGHGTWLQSGPIGKYPHRCYDGRSEATYWYEVSFGLYTKDGIKSKFFQGASAASPAVAAAKPGGIEVRRNEEKNGIEVVFPAKPSAEVIQFLKDNGFRWSGAQNLWWRKFDNTVFDAVKSRLGT